MGSGSAAGAPICVEIGAGSKAAASIASTIAGSGGSDAIVEARHGDVAVGVVQRREHRQPARVSDLARLPPCRPECRSLAAPATVTSSADEAAARHRHRWPVGAPHRAVGRDDQVAREALAHAARPAAQNAGCRTPPRPRSSILMLTGRRPAVFTNASTTRIGISTGPLSSETAARIEAAVADGRLERRCDPFFERIGRLHIVVAVDQDRGQSRVGDDHRRTPRDDRPSRRSRPLGNRRASAVPPRRPPRHECHRDRPGSVLTLAIGRTPSTSASALSALAAR